ncbi:MAG: hypothetical protein H7A48_06930 [Akkermansiaceae bacterium]|nr:hypothetical protein [Akkermansiaceae bacterium]MCP5547946.1 hypothetical protein [Akkermansiaceae bacterium]
MKKMLTGKSLCLLLVLIFLQPIELVSGEDLIERENMKNDLEEILGAGRETWMDELRAEKWANPVIFGDCLRGILKGRRLKEKVSFAVKSKYVGLKDPVLNRAIIYAIREDPGLPTLASSLVNILSLEAEGKVVESGHGKRIAKEILEVNSVESRRTLRRVLRHFGSEIRREIYNGIISRWEHGEISSSDVINVLGPSYDVEKDVQNRSLLTNLFRNIEFDFETQVAPAEQSEAASNKEVVAVSRVEDSNRGDERKKSEDELASSASPSGTGMQWVDEERGQGRVDGHKRNGLIQVVFVLALSLLFSVLIIVRIAM